MSFEQILFYLFSTLLVLAAIGVVTVRNPVYAALLLIVTFFNSAALWLLLQAEFLAITLVLVYVGAVMVLFLFVIMMLDVKIEELKESFTNYLPVGMVVLFMVVVEMILVMNSGAFNNGPAEATSTVSNTEQLGKALYIAYLYPLEIAAVILLVAIIAAILLTLRSRPDTKGQKVEQQLRVRRQDRVRLVDMKTDKQ